MLPKVTEFPQWAAIGLDIKSEGCQRAVPAFPGRWQQGCLPPQNLRGGKLRMLANKICHLGKRGGKQAVGKQRPSKVIRVRGKGWKVIIPNVETQQKFTFINL